ncbi:MAG: Acetyl-CoA synthetase, partial [uncultured Solirubrobacteraceae bacterium]
GGRHDAGPRAGAGGAPRAGDVPAARGLRPPCARHRPGTARRGREGPGGLVARPGPRAPDVGQGAHAGARRFEGPVPPVVRRRRAQRVGQLRGPPRGGRARRQGRLPLARGGGRVEGHHLRRPAPRRPAGRQRAEGRRHQARRRRGDLPADDPRGGRRDARLRAHRGAAQRRVRRLLARVGRRADGGLRGPRAHHRRRRPAQGQGGADQGRGGRGHRPRPDGRADPRRAPHGGRHADAGGARRLLGRGPGSGGLVVPAGGAARRAPAVHPLLEWLDGEAEGDPAHHGRLHDRRGDHARARLRPQAGGGRLVLLGRRRLGHRPLLHRLRAARQRRDLGHVRGRPGLPAQGHLVGAVRAGRRDAVLHRADRDPRLHEVGPAARREARPVQAAAAGDRRRADQPEGVAVVLAGGRRRALPDRGHLVADGDGRDHDHDAPGGPVRQARVGRHAAAGHRGPRRGRRGQRGRGGHPGPAHADPAVAGHAPHPLQGRRPLRGDVLLQVRQGRLPGRRRVPPGSRRLRLGHRPGRRRHQRLGAPPVHRGGGERDRRPPLRGRGGGHRAGRRGHGPEHRGVRDARGRLCRRRRDGRRAARARRQADRQARPPQADHLVRRPAQDALGEDHAPAAARHRRGPGARRRDHAARPGRHGPARGEGEGGPGGGV